MNSSATRGPTEPVSAHQRRKAARPQELLEAALSLFVEHGFAATRTDDVAQRAGVAKGTLYLYYPSKADLLKAVVKHYLADEITRGAERAQGHAGSTQDLLQTVCADWWLGLINSPASGVFKLVITEMRNFPELSDFYRQEVVEAGHRVIGAVIQRGIDRGEFRPVDVQSTAQSLLLPIVMMCLYMHSLAPCSDSAAMVPPEQFVRQHIDLVVNGLLAQR